MKTKKQTTALFVGAALLLSASAAKAGNITIADNNTSSINGVLYSETTSGWYKGAPGTTGSQASWEYQEVEPGMSPGALWDLAAFVNPANGKLGVVSGYNLGTGAVTQGTTIGDIFVKANGPGTLGGPLVPYNDPNNPYSGFTKNTFGYDFAVHFDTVAGTYTVTKLTANTVLENGEYALGKNGGLYNSASQPWKLASAGSHGLSGTTDNGSSSTTYTGLFYSSTFSTATAGDAAHAGFAVTSDYHYYVEIGTAWLNPYLDSTNPVAVYHLTMECGNDNMIGVQNAGFNQVVPDGSATLALFGLSLLGIVGAAKFRMRLVK